jgi:hypothetical protein
MNDTPIHLTISGGLAMCPSDGQSATDLLRAADNALYVAKRKGGNRILPAQSFALDGSVIDIGRAEQDGNGSASREKENGDNKNESHLELVNDDSSKMGSPGTHHTGA